MIFFRNPYNYDRDQASVDSGLEDFGPGLTKQEFRDDADINVIVRRFGLTGVLPNQGIPAPTYEDFTGVGDYHSALNHVRAAAEAFMQLPALVRQRFGNDPQQLVAFCSDSANAQEAAKLGLTAAFVVPEGEPSVRQSPALVAAPAASNPSSS